MERRFDTVVADGLFFDGSGGPAGGRHVAIKGGVVAAIEAAPIPREAAAMVIDAKGRWVTPGFIDLHTHYDAEVELAPSLSESLRHGVTSVVFGSCSLS